MPTKKPTGSSSGRAFSGDDDLAVPPPDRVQEAAGTQARAIPEGNSHELCMVLDGLVMRRLCAFDAETEGSGEARALYVPFSRTTCPAEALRICFESGLLRRKLDGMSAEDASYTYLTTIAKPEPEN